MIGSLISEIPIWFSKSTEWRAAYKQLFTILNPIEERKGTSLSFQRPFQAMDGDPLSMEGKLTQN